MQGEFQDLCLVVCECEVSDLFSTMLGGPHLWASCTVLSSAVCHKSDRYSVPKSNDIP
jgi:hypothetical protein